MKKENIIIIMLFALMIISLQFDYAVTSFLAEHRVDWLNNIMIVVTQASSEFLILLVLMIFMIYKKKEYRNIPLLLFIMLTIFIINALLKIVIARPRPAIGALVTATSYTFPSRHSSLAFGAVPMFMKEFKALGYIWLVISVVIAFSRIYVGVHYLSDVIGGALLGYSLGYFLLHLEEKYKIVERIKNKYSRA